MIIVFLFFLFLSMWKTWTWSVKCLPRSSSNPKLWMSRCIVVLILTCACIQMINQKTPMTNIWLVTQWALAARLYNDNWGDITENIWQIFVGRTFAALTRTCESGTRSLASSPPSRTWWPGVRRTSMTRVPIRMKTMMKMMILRKWKLKNPHCQRWKRINWSMAKSLNFITL